MGALAAVMAAELPAEAPVAEDDEHLLTVEEAVAVIGGHVDRDWVYRNTRGLRFRRGFTRKCIRFEEAGLRRWIASRRS